MKDYTFDTFISASAYSSKKEANIAISGYDYDKCERVKDKMAFKRMSLTIDEFAQYILSGHTYCNLFSTETFEGKDGKISYEYKGLNLRAYSHYINGKNKGCYKLQFKTDKYFEGSYIISVDIDNTNFKSIETYLNTLTYKPTFTYTSFSDREDYRKFRMIYVFDRMLDKDEFKYISNIIHTQIELDTNETVIDKCGERLSQYFNGTVNKEHYITYKVYNIDDFDNSVLNYKRETDTTDIDWIFEGNNNEKRTIKDIIREIKLKKEEKHNTIVDNSHLSTVEFDEQLINDMRYKDYGKLLYKYRDSYTFFYRVEKDEWLENEYGKYQYTDENYISLYWNRTKLKDGEQRRKKLYSRAALRRIIKPTVSPSELLFNLYVDRHKFFDDSDNVLTIDVLKYNVEMAFKKSIEELKDEFSDTIKTSNENKPSFITYNDNKLKKGESHNTIVDNSHLSKGKKSAIVNSVSKKGKTKFNIDEIKKYYNPTLSQRKNQKILMDNGIKISLQRLQELIKEYNLNGDNKLKKGEKHNTITDIDSYTQSSKSRKMSLINSIVKKGNYNIDEVKKYYDSTKSLRNNVQILKDNGIKIGKDTLNKLVKEYNLNGDNKLKKEEKHNTITDIDSYTTVETAVDYTEVNKLLSDIKQQFNKGLIGLDVYGIFRPIQEYIIKVKEKEIKDFGLNQMKLIMNKVNNSIGDYEGNFDIIYNTTFKLMNNNVA